MAVSSVTEHLNVPPAARDLTWLRQSLEIAVALEFSTIPPYLTAWWSIDPSSADPDSVADTLSSIALEEMGHMGQVCNLLRAIDGGQVLDIRKAAWKPGPLPGGVHPGLQVKLQGLSLDVIKVFMQIEFPAGGPVVLTPGELAAAAASGGLVLGQMGAATIGALYSGILDVFVSLNLPTPYPTTQQTATSVGGFAVKKVTTLDDVRDAIGRIVRQGEGATGSPDDDTPGELAHYYRFAELSAGARLKQDAAGAWGYTGANVQLPTAFPVGPVPENGYQANDIPDPTLRGKIQKFDQTYTAMVAKLQEAWSGQPNFLGQAVGQMSQLTELASDIVAIPLPNGSGRHYGPCFRLVPASPVPQT